MFSNVGLLVAAQKGGYSANSGARVWIPVQPDHRIRRKPITDSDSTRSLIYVERAFGLGPCALTEAMAWLPDRLASAET